MSVDVEEWHQTELIRENIRGTRSIESKVIESISEIVDTFNAYNVKATFFIVGMTLKKHPKCAEIILDSGHEIGFHGWTHEMLQAVHPKNFVNDLKNFQTILDEWDYVPKSFRAPSASLNSDTSWVLPILSMNGYKYDSSIFPCWTPLYGVPTAPIAPYWISQKKVDTPVSVSESLGVLEFPFLSIGPKWFRIPLGTGFYLRSFPLLLYDLALKHRKKKDIPAVISFHSWEFSRDVPALDISLLKRSYLYYGLANCRNHIEKLLSKYSFTSIHDLSQQLRQR